MTGIDERAEMNYEPKDRLTRLSQAIARINATLDFETVLRGVVDSVRSLTDAMYGLITLFDDAGQVRDNLTSGMSPEETRQLWNSPEGETIFKYFRSLEAPLRLRNFHSHTRSLGLPRFSPPVPTSPEPSFLAAPIRLQGRSLGAFFVSEKAHGREFSADDEEVLVTFASLAALVVTNARRFREEQRARADLEALIDTSPVGVAVFEATSGRLVSLNTETERIFEGLRLHDGSAEELLEDLNIRRADGRMVSLQTQSLADAFSTGETVRGEEVILQIPDGRSVTVLLNATPIRSEAGIIESIVVTMQDMTHLDELERMRAEFLAMVSHELRAPLLAIQGSATSGLTDATSLGTAEIAQLFRIIVDQSDRMDGLINDLLDVARIATGTFQINPECTPITGLVDQARNTFLNGGG